jgi:hypothetical protein
MRLRLLATALAAVCLLAAGLASAGVRPHRDSTPSASSLSASKATLRAESLAYDRMMEARWQSRKITARERRATRLAVTRVKKFQSTVATTPVPCGANLNTVALAASPGDTLLLGACSYPSQNFTSTTPIAVVGQGSATTVGDLNAHGAQNILFQNFNAADSFWVPLNGSNGGRVSANLTADGVNFTSGGIFTRGLVGGNFIHGSSGNTCNAYSQTLGAYSSAYPTRDIVIDGWSFHDMNRSCNTSGHMECLFVQESVNVLVKNSNFVRCEVFDLYVSDLFGGPISGISFQDTHFDETVRSGYYAAEINFNTDVEFLRDSWSQGLYVQNGTVSGCGNTVSGSFLFPSELLTPCSGNPPPTTTTPTTTTPPPTTTTPPPPSCNPDPGYLTCQAEITALKAENSALKATLAQIHDLSKP